MEDNDGKCCGEDMEPIGMTFGNGFKCRVCGREEPEVASWKMAGNYEELLTTEFNPGDKSKRKR